MEEKKVASSTGSALKGNFRFFSTRVRTGLKCIHPLKMELTNKTSGGEDTHEDTCMRMLSYG
jgi:hypothetical protein